MIWLKIKKNILENKKYFISIFSFFSIIILGVLSKTFLFFKEYFYYILFLIIFLFLYFIFKLKTEKEFKIFFEEAIYENFELKKEIQKDNWHIKLDLWIKYFSIFIVLILLIYLFIFKSNFLKIFF